MFGIFFIELCECYECNIFYFNFLNDVIYELDNLVNFVFFKCMFISIYIFS